MKTRIAWMLVGSAALLLVAGLARAQAQDPAGPRPLGPMHARVLEKFDTDGDGKLSPEERQAALEAAPPEVRQRIEEHRQKMLEKFDADGDGQLNDAERAAAREALKQRIAEEKQKFLEKWDKDGDGVLSDAEKAAAKEAFEGRIRQQFQERRQEFIKKWDTDGDGKLNDEERAAAREAIRERIKDHLDRNDDGKVGPIEQRMGVRQWQRRHDGEGPHGPAGGGPGAGGSE